MRGHENQGPKKNSFSYGNLRIKAWSINKTDGKLITAFEMKCYRKILRIPWTDRVTNEKVLEKVKMNSTTLLQEIRKLKVGYFGHTKRHVSLEKHIMEAKAAGRRGRGRPMRRWEQDIQDWLETPTTQAGRMAEDCELFRKKIQKATSYKG